MDPHARYGRSWDDLEKHEQVDMMAYNDVRQAEEAYRAPVKAPKLIGRGRG